MSFETGPATRAETGGHLHQDPARAATPAGPPPAADRLRVALAVRAERQAGLRAGRAERLARLRVARAPATDDDPGTRAAAAASPDAAAGAAEEPAPTIPAAAAAHTENAADLRGADAEALESFLAALVGAIQSEPEPSGRAAVLPLLRPEPSAAGDPAAGLARLPGAGPGLVGALIRAGVPDLATLAALEPAALAARLGPIARLIDLDTWIAFARTER